MRWVTSVLMVFTALQTVPTFAQSSAACGQLITLATHDATQTRYSLAGPSENAKAALVIMAGGARRPVLDQTGGPPPPAGATPGRVTVSSVSALRAQATI